LRIFEYSNYLNPSVNMKKILFVVAFGLIGFTAQAQCSKTCGGGGSASGCTDKKETASTTSVAKTDNAVASTDAKATTKSVAVANKKRRGKKSSN
jgi:hypothetical protein